MAPHSNRPERSVRFLVAIGSLTLGLFLSEWNPLDGDVFRLEFLLRALFFIALLGSLIRVAKLSVQSRSGDICRAFLKSRIVMTVLSPLQYFFSVLLFYSNIYIDVGFALPRGLFLSATLSGLYACILGIPDSLGRPHRGLPFKIASIIGYLIAILLLLILLLIYAGGYSQDFEVD